MRASSSLSTEIDVFLSDEEVSRLESRVLEGELVFRDRSEKVCSRKLLEIIRARRSNHHYWVNLETVPSGADFEAIERYKILVYPLGYRRLVERGYAGERIDAISRVDIFRE